MLINQISKLNRSDRIISRRKCKTVDSGNSSSLVQQFVKCLELSDEEILDKFQLTLDGQQITTDQARHFIAFVRQEVSRNQE
ncbi:hypothetical protein [Paenibacillus periandrae]|uniref:hypothetical protein n=1 Tax=Paenibacillus periandrae TaxID=1761741 RepID=UPI001F08EE57|nr:hypothetical protein [Paenibacillus periandrae]